MAPGLWLWIGGPLAWLLCVLSHLWSCSGRVGEVSPILGVLRRSSIDDGVETSCSRPDVVVFGPVVPLMGLVLMIFPSICGNKNNDWWDPTLLAMWGRVGYLRSGKTHSAFFYCLHWVARSGFPSFLSVVIPSSRIPYINFPYSWIVLGSMFQRYGMISLIYHFYRYSYVSAFCVLLSSYVWTPSGGGFQSSSLRLFVFHFLLDR